MSNLPTLLDAIEQSNLGVHHKSEITQAVQCAEDLRAVMERVKTIMQNLQTLRLIAKAMKFDLDCTTRERDDLKKQLEQRQ